MELTRLVLLTSDIEATKAFYEDVPGLTLKGSDEADVTFTAGSTELVFRQSDKAQPVYHFAFTIPSNKLQEAFDSLKKKTKLIHLPDGSSIADFSNWNAEAFYFYDNNGNILEYIARHEMDNATALPFEGNSICCISEIGLVTDDVPALARELSTTYGLPFFAKQPRQDHFTVLGDDQGLFIIVARERHWYPTEIAAGIFPVVVGFKDGNGQEQELHFGF